MTAANLCVHPSKANFIIDWESWAAGKFSFTTIFSYRPVIFCPRAKYWNPCFLEHPLLQGSEFIYYLHLTHLFVSSNVFTLIYNQSLNNFFSSVCASVVSLGLGHKHFSSCFPCPASFTPLLPVLLKVFSKIHSLTLNLCSRPAYREM